MKHKITDEILTEIRIKEWAKYFINTPAKPFEKINKDSLVSVKQKKEILNKTKPF